MASEWASSSLSAVIEDVLRQHQTRFSDTILASRKEEESATRRYEAAGWLRKAVGVVSAKDLPAEPSEEEFRLGLRNGLILCTALNKVHPGAVPKVVVNPGDPILHPDEAALSAYQYFENARNFLVAVEALGLPTFEASDLEQGGKGSRIVDCVLSLKSYGEWRQMGGHGPWKYGGGSKQPNPGKSFLRINSENFRKPLGRTQSLDENDSVYSEQNSQSNSRPLSILVQTVLSEKKPEEVPLIVESLLNKVMEEYEQRVASQNDLVKAASKNIHGNKAFAKSKVSMGFAFTGCDVESTQTCNLALLKKEEHIKSKSKEEASRENILKQLQVFEQQQRDIQELKCALRITKAGMEFMQREYTKELSKIGDHLHGLSRAASGYHKVLEENRKLYNRVQDLKGSIRVYCRVRPFQPGQINSCTVGCIEDGSITIITPEKYGKEGRRSFSFNKVFGPSATQEEVFADTQPLIRSVLDGYNVCIFAYGQTGSGKTYTMSGPKDLSAQTVGVNYRALSDLFKLSEERKGIFHYEIAVQMIEIYNEQVRDLLVCDGLNKRLEIHNNSQKGRNVPNASLIPVGSTSDVIKLMNIGQKNRAVGATALNDRSSRSHSCLTIHVQGRDQTSGTVLYGCMHLVDLAGSERVNKSEVTGERLKEAQHINKSLSALGDVISALAQKNSHIPYRNSKLTQLLQDSLGGQAKTLMFVHVSPEMDALGETLSTLKFAERVSTVELGAARVNKENGDVNELKEQIANLKAALGMKEGRLELPNATIPHTINIRAQSPVHSNRKNGADYLGNQSYLRQPMEDVENTETRTTSLRQKKPSFDMQELLMSNDSSPWPDSGPRMIPQTRDDTETIPGDWVDKLMVNKYETSFRNEFSKRDWAGDVSTLPEIFYQSYLSDTRADKQLDGNGMRRKESLESEMHQSRLVSTVTEDSDDLDIATSDSSEADTQWQFNFHSAHSTVNHSGSRNKKLHIKPTKSPDVIRTSNNSQIPLPSRKMSSGAKTGRVPNISSGNGRRMSSGGKMMQ